VTRDHARKKAIRARMAASGEPYSVAARALDSDELAADPEPATAEPIAPGSATSEPATAAPAAAASATEDPMAAGSAVAEPVADAGSVADPGRETDRGEALAEVIACAGRTLAAPSARIQIRDDTETGRDPEPAPRRRPGLIGRLAGRAAKAVWERVAPDTDPAELREQFLHQFGAGFIEPAAGRYLVDFGGYAQVLVDGRRFGGLSGEPLGPRYELRPHRFRRDDPLDALRRLQGATAARWTGDETVRWTPCRVAVTTAGPNEFRVWIDDQRIRRFQTVERGSGRSALATKTETVELWDFGVPVDSLDWSRLPSFRAPGSGDDAGR
jgi:hypothetical protein